MHRHAHKSNNSKHGKHVRPPYVVAFIQAHLAKAREISKRTRIPVSVLLAQACEESSYGRIAPDNSYFGIKGTSSSGGSANHATHEVVKGHAVAQNDNFRAYKDFDEAADDYANYLVSNPKLFGQAFAHVGDPIAFALAMGRSKYATNPKYGHNLVAIIKINDLLQYEVNLPKRSSASVHR